MDGERCLEMVANGGEEVVYFVGRVWLRSWRSIEAKAFLTESSLCLSAQLLPAVEPSQSFPALFGEDDQAMDPGHC